MYGTYGGAYLPPSAVIQATFIYYYENHAFLIFTPEVAQQYRVLAHGDFERTAPKRTPFLATL